MRPDRDVTALILAGGAGRRMGGADKGLLPLKGQPLIARIVDAIATQVATVLISANRHLDDYATFGYPVIEDTVPGHQGPLVGMLSGLMRTQTDYLLVQPCDVPEVVPDIARRLLEAAESAGAEVAIAHDGDRLQPVHILLHRRVAGDLRAAIEAGERKTRRWLQGRHSIAVDFSDHRTAFHNINTPGDLRVHGGTWKPNGPVD